ncbi:MAG: glutathione S-transferase domain-containing protein [Solirubrobacterales bacterium]|nr:glutathione S-transferase domain-containing protein [Solirubrobacterales bacterium]MCB8914701.1 glutathione S-transferase domain-containing protein [Thermoleophilales bacterium]
MKLYVCWGTFDVPGSNEHPCKAACDALVQADHEPEVIKTHSSGYLPRLLQTPSRKRVEDGTGSKWVPALELDDGEWISGSKEIIAWAEQHARV